MLTAILAWLAVPLRVAPRYWSLSMTTGILGGLASYHALSFCDRAFGCSSVRQILPYSTGWLVWQVFMCFALNFGSESDQDSRLPGGTRDFAGRAIAYWAEFR